MPPSSLVSFLQLPSFLPFVSSLSSSFAFLPDDLSAEVTISLPVRSSQQCSVPSFHSVWLALGAAVHFNARLPVPKTPPHRGFALNSAVPPSLAVGIFAVRRFLD